jgi:hypothetical protein
MPKKLTDKEYFIYWGKKVSNYRGTISDTINLYRKYKKFIKINGYRPNRMHL